jgi:hypothetical protein
MAKVTSIDYLVKANDGKYKFVVRITEDLTKSGPASRPWALLSLTGNPPLDIAHMRGGEWFWMPPSSARRQTWISLYDGVSKQLDMYLLDVPRDYLHGDFCAITSGPATYSTDDSEVMDMTWTVYGPGCI